MRWPREPHADASGTMKARKARKGERCIFDRNARGLADWSKARPHQVYVGMRI